ncbi:MAG: SMC-Scp complex subunit ScpB [Candidatus Bipolaricaulota bacterium]|nr:MAG: SMC-Scp complex subunit ScpB [Candidatus Bipolaricaulota bacterium]
MTPTAPQETERDRAILEAALFVSPVPVTLRALASLLGGASQPYVRGLLEEMKAVMESPDRGLELVIESTKAMLRVRSELTEVVAHLAPQQDIPRPVLRTLAVVAYNQPMTQADLVRTRGNKAYAHVQELIERGLLRAEEHGRTLLLHVTREFLRYFGLTSPEEFRFHVAGDTEAGASVAEEPEPRPEAAADTNGPADGEDDADGEG